MDALFRDWFMPFCDLSKSWGMTMAAAKIRVNALCLILFCCAKTPQPIPPPLHHHHHQNKYFHKRCAVEMTRQSRSSFLFWIATLGRLKVLVDTLDGFHSKRLFLRICIFHPFELPAHLASLAIGLEFNVGGVCSASYLDWLGIATHFFCQGLSISVYDLQVVRATFGTLFNLELKEFYNQYCPWATSYGLPFFLDIVRILVWKVWRHENTISCHTW